MKKKIAYDNKRFYKKTIISKEEYDKIVDEGAVAFEILNDERFEFVRLLLQTPRDYARESILNNTITDVSEEVTVSESIKKIFSRKRKDQVDELVGQYKVINKFFADLQDRIDTKEQLERGIANDTIVIQDD